MEVIENCKHLNQILQSKRAEGKTIGLVPTMGNLHAGHLALVHAAKQQCDFVLATIFINPLQFGANEDLSSYPRTLVADEAELQKAECDAVFIPSIDEMYSNGLNEQTIVAVPTLSSLHCGSSRPKHFDGVCTVVTKLFNLTHPDFAFFGKKDFQQLLIIRKMTIDLCFPIKIIGVEIQREKTGLALSSRNSYLSTKEKNLAADLHSTLTKIKDKILQEKANQYEELEQLAKKELSSAGLKVDYFSICNASTLLKANTTDRFLVILSAVYIGEATHQTRLIDNITLNIADTIN